MARLDIKITRAIGDQGIPSLMLQSIENRLVKEEVIVFTRDIESTQRIG
jgi:RNA-binding protein YhbY